MHNWELLLYIDNLSNLKMVIVFCENFHVFCKVNLDEVPLLKLMSSKFPQL